MSGQVMEDPLRGVDPRSLGARLREAREARGLTQQQAAEQLGIARTTMVAIEKGQRSVQPAELIELAAFYGRRISEILQRGGSSEGFAVQLRGALSPSDADEEVARGIQEFQDLCEDYLRLEELRQAPLRRRYPALYEIDLVSADIAAEDVADQERRRLALGDGPLLGLRETLENDVGLRVFELKLPGKVAGMYAFTQALGGCIAVNSAHPPERRRQSLSHEYGHFITHRYRSEVLALGPPERRPVAERFAEGFGRAFLMPADGVRRRFLDAQRERKGQLRVGDLCRLADLFAVSAEALFRRLEELDLIPAGTWARLQREGFKVREAQKMLGLERSMNTPEMLPRRFVVLAMEAWQDEQLSEGQLARFLRLDRLETRKYIQWAEPGDTQGSLTPDIAAPLFGSGSG